MPVLEIVGVISAIMIKFLLHPAIYSARKI